MTSAKVNAPIVLGFAAVVFAVARSWALPVDRSSADIIVCGGSLVLNVYRLGAIGAERVRDGASAASGDVLQLAYASPKKGYGVLLSIDGGGNVTLHLPENDTANAAPLRDGKLVRTPNAFQLDDAPGFERFFFVCAPESFDVGPVLAAARALAERGDARRQPLPLPAGFEQVSFAVDKTPPSKKDTR
jgi:hypothetical protein